jgi:hypothetical protein
MGTICTSRTNIIAMALEDATDLWVVVKLTTLIKKNVLSRDIGRVMLEPRIKPCDGGTFGNVGRTVEGASGVVCDENIAGFTIEALVGFDTSGIF